MRRRKTRLVFNYVRRLGFQQLEPRHFLAANYELSVVATRDGAANGFLELGRGPSINDSGVVAFVGTKLNNGDSNGENRLPADNIYTFDANALSPTKELMNRAFMYPKDGAHAGQAVTQVIGDMGEVQINNRGEVLARRRLNASVRIGFDVLTQPLTYFELWDGRREHALALSQSGMGDGGIGIGVPFVATLNPITSYIWPSPFDYFSDYAGLLRFGSINNNSDSAFTGISSALRGGGYELVKSGPSGFGRSTFSISNQNPLPMLSDDDKLVYRDGTNGPIFAIHMGADSPIVQSLASSTSGFTLLGPPSISDDGHVVVFLGRSDIQGEGVYVSVRRPNADNYLAATKVLGLGGDGILDPGETFVDANGNAMLDLGEDRGGVRSLDYSMRPNVNRYRSQYRLSFIGDDADANQALHVLTLGVTPDVKLVGAPIIVAREGDFLPRVSGWITKLSTYDAINSNGELAFWTETSTGAQAIVRAKTPPSKALVVVTHGFMNSWNSPFGRTDLVEGFLDSWNALGDKYREIPMPGSLLDGEVSTYVSNWNSSDGWIDAFISLVSSELLLHSGLVTASDAAATNVIVQMRDAALNAERAAIEITDDILRRIDVTPQRIESGDLPAIQLVGHSRGAAVNARVARLLTDRKVPVEEYVALDGYSVDWPLGGDILADIDISQEIQKARSQGRLRSAINYLVEDGLTAIVLRKLFDVIDSFGGSLGLGTIYTTAAIASIDAQFINWKAPSRASAGFDCDVLVQAVRPNRSNHVNITPIFLDEPKMASDTQGLKPYILDGYVARNGGYNTTACGAAAIPPSSSVYAAPPPPANIFSAYGFADFNFESTRENLAIANDPTISGHDEPLVQLWGKLMSDSKYALSSYWQSSGNVEVKVVNQNAVAELTEQEGTSLSQLVRISPADRHLEFDVNIVQPGTGDSLVVLLEGQEIGRVTLEIAGLSQVVIDLPSDVPSISRVSFELHENRGNTSKVQLDNLRITGLPGDANLDGEVGFEDFLALAANFGKAGGWSTGDFDNSGQVEFADFLILSQNYGKMAGDARGLAVDWVFRENDGTDSDAPTIPASAESENTDIEAADWWFPESRLRRRFLPVFGTFDNVR